MKRKQRQRGGVAALSILGLACVAHAQLSSDAPGIKTDREMRSERQRIGSNLEDVARRMEDPQAGRAPRGGQGAGRIERP